jgi:hypothetical protein
MTNEQHQPNVLAFLAVAVAVLAVELANWGGQPTYLVFGRAALIVGTALVVRLAIGKWQGDVSRKIWERATVAAVGAGLVWRLGFDPVPSEWLAVEALRNAAVAVVAVPAVGAAGAAVGVGLFLVLACSVLGGSAATITAAAVFCIVGAAWLAKRNGVVPWGALATVGLGTAAAAIMLHGGVAAHLAGALPGWVASSGGEGTGDELARSGVGDGPDQLGGPNGDAGFDRSDFYCETDGQCLYDAFIESYGDPVQPSADKAQWLSLPEEQIAGHRGTDLRNGRQHEPRGNTFALRRDRPSKNVAADAVLWVEADEASYPLRLPVLAFGHYHGGHWHEAEDQAVASAIPHPDAAGYFVPVDQPAGEVWGRERELVVRTGTYDANVLPMPNGLTRFRLGQVRKPELIGSAAEPMLRLNRTSIPAGSALDVAHRPPLRRLLLDEPLAEIDPTSDPHHPAAAALADEWAGHLPRGFGQVEAIIENLRQHARFDADFRAPPDTHGHNCPVEQFLCDTRRGEAHLFASSAVLMLQSLGYDARLAGGYQVSADDLDPASGQAIITKQHAHVWPQIRLAVEAGYVSSRDDKQVGIARGGQWIDLEPTPGFALADGEPTLWQQADEAGQKLADWLADHWLKGLALALLALGLWLLRRQIVGTLDVALWHLRPARSDRQLVRRTLRLLDRRAIRHGTPRPPHQTFAAWLDCPALSVAADWALHAPTDVPAPPGVQATCRAAARNAGRFGANELPFSPHAPTVAMNVPTFKAIAPTLETNEPTSGSNERAFAANLTTFTPNKATLRTAGVVSSVNPTGGAGITEAPTAA